MNHSDCCASTNTDESIELSSPLCLGESLQPTRFSLTYEPNGDKYDGRNVYESTSGEEYVFYSLSIEVMWQSIHMLNLSPEKKSCLCLIQCVYYRIDTLYYTIYCISWIISRPTIILDPYFPRLVLEVFQKLYYLWALKDALRTLKTKKIKFWSYLRVLFA